MLLLFKCYTEVKAIIRYIVKTCVQWQVYISCASHLTCTNVGICQHYSRYISTEGDNGKLVSFNMEMANNGLCFKDLNAREKMCKYLAIKYGVQYKNKPNQFILKHTCAVWVAAQA